MDANIQPVASQKYLTAVVLSDKKVNGQIVQPVDVEKAVVSPEDIRVADGKAVDGAAGGDGIVAKKDSRTSSCWNCNAPDHAVELMKCARCKRVIFIQSTSTLPAAFL